jgi:DNA polymerase
VVSEEEAPLTIARPFPVISCFSWFLLPSPFESSRSHLVSGDLNEELDETRFVVRQVRQRLEALQRAGVAAFPRPRFRDVSVVKAEPARPAPAATVEEAPPVEVVPAPEVVSPPPPPRPAPAPVVAASTMGSLFEESGFETPPVPAEERPSVLAVAAAEVARCTRCPHLAATRTQTVFGCGTPTARLMFIGEAPGADEDRLGQPFVGKAGHLLTDMITKGMRLRREDVYIANILKCRPPDNRTPTAEEAANCSSYLEHQIAVIRPEFLCLLGKTAVIGVLGVEPTTSMGRLRGRWHRYRGIKTLVTYHPSYLLRNPPAKKDAWEDLQLLMKEMGLALPGRKRGAAE